MLNLVVLPLPLAVAILVALAAASLYRQPSPLTLTVPPAAPLTGRHRLGDVDTPYRPTPLAPWPQAVSDIEPITRELVAVAS